MILKKKITEKKFYTIFRPPKVYAPPPPLVPLPQPQYVVVTPPTPAPSPNIVIVHDYSVPSHSYPTQHHHHHHHFHSQQGPRNYFPAPDIPGLLQAGLFSRLQKLS